MEIAELRAQIDRIDDQIKELFEARMELALKTREYKMKNNLPILNAKREDEIISRVTGGQNGAIKEYTKTLFLTLFRLSREYQKEH